MTDDLEKHRAWNEEMAARHDPDAFITKTAFPIRWTEARRLSLTRAALGLKPQSRFLDVGCGAGNLLATIERTEAVGIEIAETLLAAAKKRTAGKPNVQIVKAFAETIPFPADHFDAAVCSEVLEHVLDPEKVLNEIWRVTKP